MKRSVGIFLGSVFCICLLLLFFQQSNTSNETDANYDIASTMNVLGSLLTKKGKAKEAEQLLLRSLAMLKNENSNRQKDAYKYLAEHYKAVNNYEEAYKYQAGYITMSDTLAGVDEVTSMLRTQAQYEVEKRDAALALARDRHGRVRRRRRRY